MLINDPRQGVQGARADGNGKIPRLNKLVHCLGCKALLSGHSPHAEFVLGCRLITPAVVIGSKPQIAVASPIIAHFCKVCADKILPHLPAALCQVYHNILEVVAQAQAASEAVDATGDMVDPESAEGKGPKIVMP